MVLLRHITAPSPAYAVHYHSAVYMFALCPGPSIQHSTGLWIF